MLVYLMRHGIAVPGGTSLPSRLADSLEDESLDEPCSDAARSLSDRGRTRTAAAALGLRALKVRPAVILTSSLLRAVETAEIVADLLEVEGALEVTDSLEPSANPLELFSTLHSMQASHEFDDGGVLCAGHAPNLDRIIAEAIGGPFGSVFLKKCGTVCLEFPWELPGASAGSRASPEVSPRVASPRSLATRAELLWMLPPRALRQLGRIEG